MLFAPLHSGIFPVAVAALVLLATWRLLFLVTLMVLFRSVLSQFVDGRIVARARFALINTISDWTCGYVK